jgi:hypothetical protein
VWPKAAREARAHPLERWAVVTPALLHPPHLYLHSEPLGHFQNQPYCRFSTASRKNCGGWGRGREGVEGVMALHDGLASHCSPEASSHPPSPLPPAPHLADDVGRVGGLLRAVLLLHHLLQRLLVPVLHALLVLLAVVAPGGGVVQGLEVACGPRPRLPWQPYTALSPALPLPLTPPTPPPPVAVEVDLGGLALHIEVVAELALEALLALRGQGHGEGNGRGRGRGCRRRRWPECLPLLSHGGCPRPPQIPSTRSLGPTPGRHLAVAVELAHDGLGVDAGGHLGGRGGGGRS